MGFLEQQEGLSLNLCTIIHTLACLDGCSIHLYVLAVIKKCNSLYVLKWLSLCPKADG